MGNNKSEKFDLALEKLNPRIVAVQIGIRKPRLLNIYPLSLLDQTSVGDLVVELVGEFFEKTGKAGNVLNDIAAFAFFNELIKRNLTKIFQILTGLEDVSDVLKETDNQQLTEIINIVYEKNYKELLKNVKRLYREVKGDSTLEKPLENSLDITPNTDLKMSSESPLKTED